MSSNGTNGLNNAPGRGVVRSASSGALPTGDGYAPNSRNGRSNGLSSVASAGALPPLRASLNAPLRDDIPKVGLPSMMRTIKHSPEAHHKAWENKLPGETMNAFRRLDPNVGMGSFAAQPRRVKKAAQQEPKPQEHTQPVPLEEQAEVEPEIHPHISRISKIFCSKGKNIDGPEDADDPEAEEEDVEVAAANQKLHIMLDCSAPEVDEDELLKEQVANVHSGEDAIAFFAKNGSHTSIKLLYCNRLVPTEPTDFVPYDLTVVAEDQVNPEYFTVSSSGIVHVCPGQLSEMITLTEWMHQSLMYRVLTSMTFFKFYIHKKVFVQWEANARYEVYCKHRKRLARSCFMTKPLFVESLVQIHGLLHEVEEIKVMAIDAGAIAYHLSEFSNKQADIRSNPVNGAQKDFEQKHDAVVMILDRLIATANRAVDASPISKFPDGRSKSMVQEKMEARERARHQKIARQDTQMLGDCIRLVDYMFQQALVTVIISATQDLADRLLAGQQKFFTIAVGFADTSITLDPPRELFIETLQRLWEGVIGVVNSVQSFTSVRQYEQYTKIMTHQSTAQILMNNKTYLMRTEKTLSNVNGQIDSVQTYATDQYEPYRKIYLYGQEWDEEAFHAQEHTYDDLFNQMSKMRSYLDELEKNFKQNHMLGVMAVDGKSLRNELLPIPEQALTTMKKSLAQMAREKCKVTFERYDSVNKALDEHPRDLVKYSNYVRMYQMVESEREEMESMMEEVETMQQVMKQFNVKTTMDDQIQHDSLVNREHEFTHTKMIESKMHIDEVQQGMVDDNHQKSLAVEERMVSIQEELQQGSFIDAEKIPYAHEVLEELERLHEETISKLDQQATTGAENEVLLGAHESSLASEGGKFEFAELAKAKGVYTEKLKLWTTVATWQDNTQAWMGNDFNKVDVENLNKEVMVAFKTIGALARANKGDEICIRMKEEIGQFREKTQAIQDLGNQAIRPRHWEKLFKKINLPWKGPSSASSITLNMLEQNGIFDHKEFISEVSANASGEFALETQLEKVIAEWTDNNLPIMNHRNQKDLWILGDLADIITLVEDHSVTIATMMGSRFIHGIKEKVEIWEKKINTASDVIDEWYMVQRAWMYLENIFSAEDIQQQLPTEAAKFKQVDKFWKELFRKVRQSFKQAIDAFHIPNLLPQLKQANDSLENVQKKLELYLETKRAAFPRFYFLSNDELLSILSQTRNPHAVQEHLCKCFDSICRVDFSTEAGKTHEILAMCDMIKERVPFEEPVVTGPVVEKWLYDIELAMVQGLYVESKGSLMKYPEDATNRTEWLLEGSPASQGKLMVDQVHWTDDAELALNAIERGENPKAMEENIALNNRQLANSVSIVRMQISKLQRVLMGALIVLDVHGITVLENLRDAKVSSASEFDWSKQLRYYWIPPGTEVISSIMQVIEDNCICRQTISSFRYSYEYLGNTPRLVVTPLTDKCYMTLTGAMHLNYGGAPAGPAGTGKTETTKDLGKALAVPVVVFNCSDGLDYKIMGRFFSGLAQAGVWACFDEFNRIQVEVLSVIAQQMLTITQAIKGRKETFDFMGNEIPLNMRFGVYITMNPGYAGRAELPDNLKALFRPVAMMVPDYRLIAEIILYSEGFDGAKQLARKMVSLYSLSSEQLSKQDHYDFGMRAVKSVLVMAGHLKRQNPELEENITLIRALRDSNAPKFLSFDLPLFNGIIGDLYPSAIIPEVDYGQLKIEIENQLRLAKYQIVPEFVTKITQLLETQIVRHGVMLVGLTMVGKSTDSDILAKTLSQLKKNGSEDAAHQNVRVKFLNPKSITMEELYGSFNDNTGEWKDGLVAILVREAVFDSTDDKKWITFDGPVDAIWIENMNTVLDDNKMLCLSNGERIKLPGTMTIMFEVADLSVASPATVSRCGMVYLEPVHLGWQPLIATWVEQFEIKFPRYAKDLGKWALGVAEAAIPFIREYCQEAPGIPTMDSNITQAYLRMLSTFISPKHGFIPEEDALERKPPRDEAAADKLVRIYCAMSCIWSLGANLHEDSRGKFLDFVRPMLQKFCPDVPESGNLFLMCVDDEAGCIQPLNKVVPDFTYDPNESFFNILVPTAETTGQRMMVDNCMTAGFNVLFSGDTGVGKSVGIQAFLNTCDEHYTTGGANFSAQTSTTNVGDLFENRLEKKRKNLLGAPPGKTMLFFVDDINMPMLETYGAQPPIELLRQVIDYGGFYDQKKLFWKNVQDVQFIAACGPPGGGKMVVTPRLFRHFNMIWTPALSEEAMVRILSSILGGWIGCVKPDLADLTSGIVRAGVEVFYRCQGDLLPTPVKCHYTFNLRDPAKMVQGMMMVSVKHSMNNKKDLMNLFLHESCRQFRDRLIDDTDKGWFNDMIASKLGSAMGQKINVDDFAGVIFGDFLDRDVKPYQQVESEQQCADIFNEWLEDYNSVNPSKMDIVFFKDACHHLARCTRVIRQPRGNMLMVGVSGVGRKCVGRMGAHMSDYECCSIEITRTYGPNEFKEDIKGMMLKIAKSGGKGLMFLFSDSQIVKESFLEDINNILNTGEVPNLFAPDELEQVISAMRPVAKEAGKQDSKDAIWQYFVQVIRENMHITLAFSPIGEGFRGRCRQFPSIINCASIDWYTAWPADALYAVAERRYKAAPKELELESILPKLADVSQFMHSSSRATAEDFYDSLRRRTYMTPTSYLELIGLFTNLLGTVKGQLSIKLQRYVVGGKTLQETKVVVDDLKATLEQMQPNIVKAKKDTGELIIQVDKDKAIANEKSAECEIDAKAAGEAAAEAGAVAADCQADLDEALPEYNNAIKSLDALDKKDIQEIKSFAKPPPLVEVVLSAVCLLMGSKESWDEAKKLMGDSQFLDKLKTYDKDALSNNAKLTAKLQKNYMKREDFTPDAVRKVSNAACSLCMWVKAMDIYGRVAREIEPKKAMLKGAENTRDEAQAKLATKKKELKIVLDKVAALEAQLAEAKAKSEQLDADAADCVVKLARAEKLLGGLGNESVRWVAASKVLQGNLTYVIGNVILAGGFIAYTGAFTAEFRRVLVKQWLAKVQENDLEADPAWKCADVLVDPAEVRQWNIWQLPSDDLSVENAIMVTRGRRWPLMIDPQGQANKWVRSMGKGKNIIVTKLSDPIYLRKLEDCIRNGKACMIENVEEVLDPALEPVLVKALFKTGGQWNIRLGTEDVPYDLDFAFYVTTKMANPHYLPEVCIKVTIINFTVTLLGLEDQLVMEVVASERPDLAAQRVELVVQIAADKKTGDDLEQKILKMLDEAGGDVLKDDSLNVVLDQSKQVGSEVKDRMVVAEKAMAQIEEIKEKLRPVACRASILYFVLADFANIDPMYQYSLEYFQGLFNGRLRDAGKSEDVNERIQILIKDFTRFIYVNICRGLFEDHKLLFSFLITCQIIKNPVHSKFCNKTLLPASEWLFFLRGAGAGTGVVEERAEGEFEPPDWVAAPSWISLDILERLCVANGEKNLEGLCAAILKGGPWTKFCMSDSLDKDAFPSPWEKKLTAFQKMLVVKCLKENLFTLVARNVVSAELGDYFIESPPFDLAGAYDDSMSTTPLIFVLSSGADPTEYLLQLAQEKGYGERLHFISLGQGQGPKAEALVKLGWDTGDWVCLQNCHLAASWMPKLEALQESQDPKKINEEYRLWLTSMPSPLFPVPVLQSGVKITNEPPKGLRANIGRTFTDINSDVYEACPQKPYEFKKLLFGLAFFHAVILERRKFGPIGWNIPYEWMDSDFNVSREQVKMYLADAPIVPWITLRYIIAEVNYGGRVTDDKDVRLISAVLKNYFQPKMLSEDWRFAGLDAYPAPKEGTLEECKELVMQFPMDEDPRIFGLHPNALITAQFNQANKFHDTVLSVQPRIAAVGGGKSSEEIVDEIALGYLDRIPDAAKTKNAHAETYKTIEGGGIVSIGVFHGQEWERMSGMIGTIKKSLKDLGKAIKGTILMGAELEQMFNAFLLQKVPNNWVKVAYPCLKPLNAWMVDYILRIEFMADWLLQGPPMSFWISCFFFPQGFMTSALQLHARKTKQPIDDLCFFSETTEFPTYEDVKAPKADGVMLHGLFIMGCGWHVEGRELKESEKNVLYENMPVIWLEPIGVTDLEPRIAERNLYPCPIYKTSERKGTLSTTGHSTNFVKYFHLKQPVEDPSHWTSRGVAMLCMLDT